MYKPKQLENGQEPFMKKSQILGREGSFCDGSECASTIVREFPPCTAAWTRR